MNKLFKLISQFSYPFYKNSKTLISLSGLMINEVLSNSLLTIGSVS